MWVPEDVLLIRNTHLFLSDLHRKCVKLQTIQSARVYTAIHIYNSIHVINTCDIVIMIPNNYVSEDLLVDKLYRTGNNV